MGRANFTNEKLLFRILNNKNYYASFENIIELRKRPSIELFKTCVELIQSPNDRFRKAGIHILSQLGNPPRPFVNETIALFFNRLAIENNDDIIVDFLYAIGHNNDDLNTDQVVKLSVFKNNANHFIREALVFALLRVNNLKAIQILIHLSNDKYSIIRNWATFGIANQNERNNKQIRAALWQRVTDKHEETHFEAIVGLATRRVMGIEKVIANELLNDNFGSLLFEAILAMPNKQYLPRLKVILYETENDNDICKYWFDDLKACIEALEGME